MAVFGKSDENMSSYLYYIPDYAKSQLQEQPIKKQIVNNGSR